MTQMEVLGPHMPQFLCLQKDKCAHVTLDHICLKVNIKLQNILIHINYWNIVMLACSEVKLLISNLVCFICVTSEKGTKNHDKINP